MICARVFSLLQTDRTERLLGSGFGVLQEFRDHIIILRALLMWAQIRCRQSDYEKATYFLRKALRIAQQQNFQQYCKKIRGQMISVALYQKKCDKGMLLFSRPVAKPNASQSIH